MADGAKRTGFLAWLVAFVVPPVVAGGLGQQFVAHHSVWAVGIGVAYETLVAIGGFFVVIARDVSARWQARFADRIDLFLQRKAARFERRYREFVLGGLRFMDHKGLATVGPFTPELEAVFVNVTLVPRPPQQISPGILPEQADELAGHRALADFLGRRKPAGLAVVGSPGSGKTTLLRHAARQACTRKRSRRNRERNIPILLYLRDHAAAITADPAVSVAALLRTTLGSIGADEPPDWFEQKLREGQCLVLLDGLDEVPRQDDRAKVSIWAESQVRLYPRNDFVISSRPQGYLSAPVEGLSILQVCGFTGNQVEAFVRGWYRAVERHSTGTDGPETEALANDRAVDLLQRLEQAPALYDLTVNPLLLTMIANVHRFRSALPGSRADLYSEICEVMLWRRQDAKRLTQQIGGDKKEIVLRNLAYVMMGRRVSDLNRAVVLSIIQPTLRRVARGVSSDGFLDDVSSNGLLIERETGQYAFAHKTFQEYLAAEHIRANGLVNDLARSVNDEWWAETTLLYVAKSDADPIVKACLDANSGLALALALDCTNQDDVDIDPDLRERVNDLVRSAAGPHADGVLRRLFAGILLARHMRQRERTTSGVQICVRPIPMNIYRLFMADTRTPPPDAPMVTEGVVLGMRGIDAVAFARWAIAVSGGQQGYRLPRKAELAELASQQRIPALASGDASYVWVQSEDAQSGTLPTLWLPPGSGYPYEIKNLTLVGAVEDDLERSGTQLGRLLLLLRSRIFIRILALALDLAVRGDLVLDSGVTVDRVLVLGRVRDRIHDLDRAFALDRILDFSRILEFSRGLLLDLDGALQFDLILNRNVARHLADCRAFVLDPVLVSVLDRVLVRILNNLLDLDGVLELSTDIENAIRHYLSPKPGGDIQSILETACRLGLGRAFSQAIDKAFRYGGQPEQWPGQFAAAFIEEARINTMERLATEPVGLEEVLRDSVKSLIAALNRVPQGSGEALSWSTVMAERLSQSAEPIFSRAEQVTPGQANFIRMAALCLAVQAESIARQDIANTFRQVAAGITFLERRASGEQPIHEAIMLAVTPS